jgi:hypothetical protein
MSATATTQERTRVPDLPSYQGQRGAMLEERGDVET